jgi:hypothetical protein
MSERCMLSHGSQPIYGSPARRNLPKQKMNVWCSIALGTEPIVLEANLKDLQNVERNYSAAERYNQLFSTIYICQNLYDKEYTCTSTYK